MKDALRGKIVCITGAASGIGNALAERVLRDGARVAGIDLDAAALDRWIGRHSGSGEQAIALPCDVTDEGACREAVSRVVDRWGRLDLLVNCAGIAHRSLLAETSCEVLRRVMDVNFFGAVYCTHASLPHLIASRGTVVAVSSVAGFAPLIGRTAYAASKHALHGFFDTLRSELRGTGVGVVVVCPSFTDTPMDSRALAGDGSTLRRRKPTVGKLLTPASVAEAIVRGVLRRRRLVLVSPTAHLAWWVSRLLPDLYERLMVARLRSEYESSS